MATKWADLTAGNAAVYCDVMLGVMMMMMMLRMMLLTMMF